MDALFDYSYPKDLDLPLKYNQYLINFPYLKFGLEFP